ncbi:zinc ribbon domain-containing protein [Tautonia plasticadhaerens]|uniref:Uncharacterized protein n=1 Tax=Tautonia plasticadhaerens TaxID=2527974 RepID=A0A518GWP3_9BACT|nr:hypothetical protein [Tautonia plasticadhaerens]QDV33015.1 hypothetical protein ElP_08570 [Tautonia plasticadhaerens]
MGSSLAFGCPECGRRIDLGRTSPGRRVRCGHCGTLAEVPFFPRRFGMRRRRLPRWRAWLPLAATVLAVVAGPLVAWQWWESSIRSARRAELAGALAEAGEAERGGDPASALLLLERASSIALRHGLEPPGGRSALVVRRDEQARLAAESRLATLPGLPPDLALDEAKALFDRVMADPALADLAGPASRALTSAADRWADCRLEQADRARASGRSAEALAEAGRVDDGLDRLPRGVAEGARDRVRSFAAALIELKGARVGPIVVRVAPSAPSGGPIEGEVAAILARGLADRGYLLLPDDSTIAGLAGTPPFRLGATIVEREGARYQHSPNRTTCFAVDLALDRLGSDAWAEHVEARTRVPLPGLAAMEGSRLALATDRSPEVEARFRRDALEELADRLRLKLKGLPPAPEAP